MAKEALGTKRLDPETGKKFYDLGRDPIVSPYTGKSYPISYFENVVKTQITESVELETDDPLTTSLDSPEFLTLEEADDEEVAEDNMTNLDDETTPMVDVDVEDAFLEEDDDSEVKDIIGEGFSDDDEL